MSDKPTLIELDSQPYYNNGWTDTQLDSPTPSQSIAEEDELTNTQAAAAQAALLTVCYKDQIQHSQKRKRTESLASAATSISSVSPVLPTSTATATETARSSIPATTPQRVSDPMKFRGTMPLTWNLTAFKH